MKTYNCEKCGYTHAKARKDCKTLKKIKKKPLCPNDDGLTDFYDPCELCGEHHYAKCEEEFIYGYCINCGYFHCMTDEKIKAQKKTSKFDFILVKDGSDHAKISIGGTK